MTRWILAGTNTELTTSIENLIIAWLQVHWSDAGMTVDPPLTSVKITDQWWNGQGMYQISVRPMTTVIQQTSVGGRMITYMTAVALHIFARRHTEMSTDVQVQNMLSEIDRIVNLYQTNISTGVLYCDIDAVRDIPDDSDYPDMYHKMIILKVYYAKAML